MKFPCITRGTETNVRQHVNYCCPCYSELGFASIVFWTVWGLALRFLGRIVAFFGCIWPTLPNLAPHCPHFGHFLSIHVRNSAEVCISAASAQIDVSKTVSCRMLQISRSENLALKPLIISLPQSSKALCARNSMKTW